MLACSLALILQLGRQLGVLPSNYQNQLRVVHMVIGRVCSPNQPMFVCGLRSLRRVVVAGPDRRIKNPNTDTKGASDCGLYTSQMIFFKVMGFFKARPIFKEVMNIYVMQTKSVCENIYIYTYIYIYIYIKIDRYMLCQRASADLGIVETNWWISGHFKMATNPRIPFNSTNISFWITWIRRPIKIDLATYLMQYARWFYPGTFMASWSVLTEFSCSGVVRGCC